MLILLGLELPPKSEIQIFSTEESVYQISDIIISGLIFKPIGLIMDILRQRCDNFPLTHSFRFARASWV